MTIAQDQIGDVLEKQGVILKFLFGRKFRSNSQRVTDVSGEAGQKVPISHHVRNNLLLEPQRLGIAPAAVQAEFEKERF